MNEVDAIRHFNEIFGFLTLEIDGEKVKIKFSIGSLIDLKENGIDVFNKDSLGESLHDPSNIAKLIYYGMPREHQAKIEIKELAYKIDLEKIGEIAERVRGKFKEDNMIETKQENSLDTISDNQEPAKKKLI
jgi:hypothetical protein